MTTRRRSVGGPGALAASLLVLTLLVVPGAALATYGATPPGASWASFSSGGIRVIFPSTLPEVNLVDNANTTLGAVLQVDAVFELAPGGLPHPTIVAAAFPTQASAFNATPTENLSNAPVAQSAVLDVRAVNVALWSSTGIATYLGAPIGTAAVGLRYTALAQGSGVSVGWTVIGWPWVSPSDLLALELHVDLSPGGGVTPCTGPPSGTPGPAACPAAPIPTRGIDWDPTISSVVATGPAGDAASLSWTATTTLLDGTAASLMVGTFAPWNSSAEVVLASPAGGTGALSGNLAFSLFPPTPSVAPAPPPLLRGSIGPYAVAAAVSGILVVVGLLAYRRRERAIRDEL